MTKIKLKKPRVKRTVEAGTKIKAMKEEMRSRLEKTV